MTEMVMMIDMEKVLVIFEVFARWRTTADFFYLSTNEMHFMGNRSITYC